MRDKRRCYKTSSRPLTERFVTAKLTLMLLRRRFRELDKKFLEFEEEVSSLKHFQLAKYHKEIERNL